MSNEALDRRIALEFMKYEDRGGGCYGHLIQDNGTVQLRNLIDRFQPSWNIYDAYVVLEKLKAVSGVIEIKSYGGREYEVCFSTVTYVPNESGGYVDNTISSTNESLPLAISKLAEAIMDSPEHMSLFK